MRWVPPPPPTSIFCFRQTCWLQRREREQHFEWPRTRRRSSPTAQFCYDCPELVMPERTSEGEEELFFQWYKRGAGGNEGASRTVKRMLETVVIWHRATLRRWPRTPPGSWGRPLSAFDPSLEVCCWPWACWRRRRGAGKSQRLSGWRAESPPARSTPPDTHTHTHLLYNTLLSHHDVLFSCAPTIRLNNAN